MTLDNSARAARGAWVFLSVCRAVLCLLVLLAFSARAAEPAGSPNQPAFGPLPAWVVTFEAGTSRPTEDDAARGTIERLLSIQHHLPASETCLQFSRTVTSLDGVQDFSEISVEWDPSYQSLVFHWVRLRRGDEVIDLTGPERFQVFRREKNLQRYILDGRLSALALLEDVRVGDTIEYAYTLRGRNPVFDGHFAQMLRTESSFPIGRLEYRLLHAPETKLRVRVAGRPVLQASTGTTAEGLVELRWSGRDLPAVALDANRPKWFETHSFLEFSTFASWEEVVRWGRRLFSAPIPGGDLAERVARLRELPVSEDERIATAVALVQDEVRYQGIMLGEGTHRPNAPTEVWRRRYGDCKDKSLLLATVLRGLGLDASVALVDATGGRLLKDKLPSSAVFDHAIVCLRRGGQTYWIDGTQSHQGTGLATRDLPAFDLALVLAEGETGLTKVEPAQPRVSTKSVLHKFVQTAWGEPAQLECEFTYEGQQAEEVRSYFATHDRASISRRSTEFVRHTYEGAVESAPYQLVDDRRANRLVVREFYRIPEPWRRDEKRGGRQLRLAATALSQMLARPSTAPRQAPLLQPWPLVVEHRFEVTLPEDFPPAKESKSVKSPAFRYQSQVLHRGRIWRGSYRWESLADQIEPEGLADYARKMSEVTNDLGWTFTSRRPATREPRRPAPPTGYDPVAGSRPPRSR